MIIHGDKDIENRTWTTRMRGPVLIHAGGGCTRREYGETSDYARFCHGDSIWVDYPKSEDLQRGGIVGQGCAIRCRWYGGRSGER